jgi:hypothetical protein
MMRPWHKGAKALGNAREITFKLRQLQTSGWSVSTSALLSFVHKGAGGLFNQNIVRRRGEWLASLANRAVERTASGALRSISVAR